MSAILIAGSRTLKGQIFYDMLHSFIAQIPRNAIIVSGMAEGVDLYAHNAAKTLGFHVKEYPVKDFEWNLIGKRAGHVRNEIMATYVKLVGGEAHLFIVEGHMTNGTESMRKLCVRYAIPYTLHAMTFTPEDLALPVRDWRRA